MPTKRDDLNGAEHDNKPTHKLEDLQVYKVDLVKRPATGDAFLAVRSADAGGEAVTTKKRRAMSVDQFRQQYRSVDDNSVTIAQRGDPVGKAPVERAVPDADASTEDKREAQKKRSEKYGIEALEDKGERLSYPSNFPTKESLYGDPVNLKFPHATADNEIDVGRATNARTRFKQFADTYEKEKSKKIVHTRIVEAELKAGASPGYDENDPLDKLLPQELVDKLEQGVERESNEDKEGDEMTKVILERMDKLTATVGVLVQRMTPEVMAPIPDQVTEPGAEPPVNPEPEATATPEPEVAPVVLKPEATATSEPEVAPVVPEPEATVPEVTPATTDAPAVETAAVERLNASLETVVSTMEGVARGMEATGSAVTAVGKRVSTLTESVTTLTQRMNSMERGMSTSNVQPVDDTEVESGTVERGADGEPVKKSVFRGVLFGGRQANQG